MSRSPLGIVLAAGLGTRMRSQTPKVMHTAAGRPLLAWILGTLAEVDARPVVVLSKESEPVRIDRAVPPRRMKWCPRARSVVEANAGTADRFVAALRG